MITAATFEGDGNDQHKNNVGLPYSHALTIMGIKLVNSEVDGAEIKLLKIRNPWSKEYFKGEWSDSSSKWTADLLD